MQEGSQGFRRFGLVIGLVLALGNLTDDVAREAKFWRQTNGTSKKKHKKS